jgi:hypothetical protein
MADDRDYFAAVNVWLNIHGFESEEDETIDAMWYAGTCPPPGDPQLQLAQILFDSVPIDPDDPRAPHEQVIAHARAGRFLPACDTAPADREKRGNICLT